MSARKAEGVANSKVNRTLEVVRAVLRRAAYDWDWISKAPRVRMLPEPKRRIRWLTREGADQLIGTLPGHLAAMARFSLETGLRRSNVTATWSKKPCNPWTTRSARGCHLCLRYGPSPMCPVRTLNYLARPAGFEPTTPWFVVRTAR